MTLKLARRRRAPLLPVVWALSWSLAALLALLTRADAVPARADEALLGWALLTPLILLLAQRLPTERTSLRRTLPLHALASLLFHAVGTLVGLALSALLTTAPVRAGIATVYEQAFVRWSWLGILVYWSVLAISHAIDEHRRVREREERNAMLEAELVQTQLQLLRVQLQPHFLFNTLHAISTLMHRDVDAAERMLIRLADLLRLTLHDVGNQEIALEDELGLLEHYVEIERMRFGERLSIVVDVADEARTALVPNLLLQPLVENAIKHGIAPRTERGRIDIVGRREGERLALEIRDDGEGLPRGAPRPLREGIGLSNTRQRLEQLYGEAQELDIGSGASGGVTVRLTLPYRPAPPAEPSVEVFEDVPQSAYRR